jgi:vacuolar-type H+-ATPase subunit C/Vma6
MDRKRVEKLQRAVYKTYLSNLVTLVQKRHGKLDYEYIAVRK